MASGNNSLDNIPSIDLEIKPNFPLAYGMIIPEKVTSPQEKSPTPILYRVIIFV